MRPEYEEQYKDPRWLLKRKCILERDEYRCASCGAKHILNVHHTYYSGGFAPWEYPDDNLITLCKNCHKKWHETHDIEYKSHPQGSPKIKKKKPTPPRKNKKQRKSKPSRLYSHATQKPRICWAEIQAHKNDFIKLRDGTWVRRRKKKD